MSYATRASTRSGLPEPAWIFSGAATMTAPVGGGGGELGEVAQALQAEFVGPVQEGVARVGQAPGVGLAGVGVDGLHAEAAHVALPDEPLHGLLGRPGGVVAVRAQ